MGTLRTLVTYRVSISAVTDIPGRKISFSCTRKRTSKRVASCCWPLLLPPPPPEELPELGLLPLEEFAISVTTALNFLSRNASTSSRAFCPTAIRTTSISPMSTRASMALRSATVITSVPDIIAVPTTRSPNSEFSLLTVPAIGE